MFWDFGPRNQGWQTLRSSWLLLSSPLAPRCFFSHDGILLLLVSLPILDEASRCDLLLGGLPYLILLQPVSLIRDLSLVRYSTSHHPQLTPPSREREERRTRAQSPDPKDNAARRDPPVMPRLQSHGSVLRTCDTSSKALSTSTSPAGAGRDSIRDRHWHK